MLCVMSYEFEVSCWGKVQQGDDDEKMRVDGWVERYKCYKFVYNCRFGTRTPYVPPVHTSSTSRRINGSQ